jgi:hypothetical protein
MRPYQHLRLEQFPDVADIQREGRASHVGKLREKSGEFKPYIRNAKARRAVRRLLKRRDKAKTFTEREWV